MSLTTSHDPASRPRSPWSGSQYQTRHRWQLDLVRNLGKAVGQLRALAAELSAAHRAGWELVEPMRGGHLLAARPSRRQRARRAPEPSPPARGTSLWAPAHRWRLRVVDDPPPVPG